MSSWDVVDFVVEGCRVPIDHLLGFVVGFVKLDIEIDEIVVHMVVDNIDSADLMVAVDNFDPMTDIEVVGSVVDSAIVVAGHNTVLNIEIVVAHHYSVPTIDVVVDYSPFYFLVQCHEISPVAMMLLLHYHYQYPK